MSDEISIEGASDKAEKDFIVLKHKIEGFSSDITAVLTDPDETSGFLYHIESQNFDNTTYYIGLEFTEPHRLDSRSNDEVYELKIDADVDNSEQLSDVKKLLYELLHELNIEEPTVRQDYPTGRLRSSHYLNLEDSKELI